MGLYVPLCFSLNVPYASEAVATERNCSFLIRGSLSRIKPSCRYVQNNSIDSSAINSPYFIRLKVRSERKNDSFAGKSVSRGYGSGVKHFDKLVSYENTPSPPRCITCCKCYFGSRYVASGFGFSIIAVIFKKVIGT